MKNSGNLSRERIQRIKRCDKRKSGSVYKAEMDSNTTDVNIPFLTKGKSSRKSIRKIWTFKKHRSVKETLISCLLQLGTKPATQAFALTRNQICGLAGQHPTEPYKPGL